MSEDKIRLVADVVADTNQVVPVSDGIRDALV